MCVYVYMLECICICISTIKMLKIPLLPTGSYYNNLPHKET